MRVLTQLQHYDNLISLVPEDAELRLKGALARWDGNKMRLIHAPDTMAEPHQFRLTDLTVNGESLKHFVASLPQPIRLKHSGETVPSTVNQDSGT